MINKVLLGLIAAVAIGIVVVGSNEQRANQTAAATPLAEEKVDGVVDTKGFFSDTQKASDTLLVNADAHTTLSTFATLIQAVGYTAMLKERGGTYTIFAPNDAAWEAFSKGSPDSILANHTKTAMTSLTALLGYHIVSGTYTTKDLTDGLTLTTIQGEKLTVSRSKDKIFINGDIAILSSESPTDAVTIHIVSGVLVPQILETEGNVKHETAPQVVENDGQTQTLCIDNNDDTATLQKQVQKKILWFFLGTWDNQGDPVIEQGSCKDKVGTIIDSGVLERRAKHRNQCIPSGNSYTVGIQQYHGGFLGLFGNWQFLPGSTTEGTNSSGDAQVYCDWYNNLYGQDIWLVEI